MKYLSKALQDGEKPLCRSHLHPIFLISGLLWLACLAGIGWILDYLLWSHFGSYIPANEIDISNVQLGLRPGQIGFLFTLGGLFIFAAEFVKYISTDIVVTTKRILYKTGLVKVKVDATDLVDVLGVHIDQGWFGQFLGYGKMHIDCRFVEDVYIPYAKNPYGLMTTMQKAKEGTHHDNPVDSKRGDDRVVSQTLIQGNVYVVDKLPPDDREPLKNLPKNLGDNLLSTFRNKS